MAQSNSRRVAPAEQVLEIVRTFEAPRELVFRLWSRPEFIVRWWGPAGLCLSQCEMDFRVGGGWRYTMHSVGGGEYAVSGVYREIIEPSRLSFTYGDASGDALVNTLVEIDFIDFGNRTEMRFRQGPFADAGICDAHNWGWQSTLGLLGDYLVRALAAENDLVGPPRDAGVAPDLVAARDKYLRTGDVPERQALIDLGEPDATGGAQDD